MTPQQLLLADYVEHGSEEAFRQLVAHYIGMVHGTATRLLNGDTHQAEDVAQIVFADLARSARALSKDVVLGGWLHRHTCYTAANVRRGDRRRQNRENQAYEMKTVLDNAHDSLEQVTPLLDEAINQLGSSDRAAIMLRFFEQQNLTAIGQVFGSNENAAQKRVARALEKLRSLLLRRGVALSGAALVAILTAQSATAAPVGIAAGIATTALSGATAKTGSTLTLLKLIIMTKLKTLAVTAIVVAVLAGGTTVALKYERPYQPKNPNPTKVLQEAEEDTTAGRYQDSLAKHVWYHENALRLGSGQQGVRLSYALVDWVKLGASYPAALKKLRAIRDEDGKILHSDKIDSNKNSWQLFQDFSSINNYLKEEAQTEKLFLWLDAHTPAFAKRVYPLAEPSLLQAKNYALCGRYIEPDDSYHTIINNYEVLGRMPSSLTSGPAGKQLNKYRTNSFIHSTTKLVALLTLTDRVADADRISDKALKQIDTPEFRTQLEDAKSGTVPPKYP